MTSPLTQPQFRPELRLSDVLVFDEFVKHMRFQLRNNAQKGEWMDYVTDADPDLLERIVKEIENHTYKLTQSLLMYSHIKDGPHQQMSPLAERYWLQLVAEYAADVANCALFAFAAMLNLPCTLEAQKLPVIPEDFDDPRRQQAQDEVFAQMGVPNPYKTQAHQLGQMQRVLRQAAVLAGRSTQNTEE